MVRLTGWVIWRGMPHVHTYSNSSIDICTLFARAIRRKRRALRRGTKDGMRTRSIIIIIVQLQTITIIAAVDEDGAVAAG
jgi:hypothetical protein